MALRLLTVEDSGEVVDTGITRIVDTEFERCVHCSYFTAVKRSIPVDQRKYYIEGVGQTHKECYEHLNGERDEFPELISIYEPTNLEIFRKRGLKALINNILRNP